MPTMRAMQISAKGGNYELVERPLPEPGPGRIRVKVEACGICYSDRYVKDGLNPNVTYPRVPGHEVVGIVDKLGDGVRIWQTGQRVGVGWQGGYCFFCDPCKRGDFINCRHAGTTGITHDGGYAEYMITPQEAAAPVPEGMSAVEAAPLLCAGITVFNALRNSGATGGDTVAIQGIGGLGHLAIQFADKMGFRTIAISSSNDKADLAQKLGADLFIPSSDVDPVDELVRLGGADVIVSTAPVGKGVGALLGGLAPNGRLIGLAGTGGQTEVMLPALIRGRKSIKGWASGSAIDWQDTMNFCKLTGCRAMIEEFPLEKVQDGYDKMMRNEVRFRGVAVV
ncbi:MAG: alcohol dehydrogenase [Candidatus Zixiibacteriota bacterium]